MKVRLEEGKVWEGERIYDCQEEEGKVKGKEGVPMEWN